MHALDDFLHRHALKNASLGLGQTYSPSNSETLSSTAPNGASSRRTPVGAFKDPSTSWRKTLQAPRQRVEQPIVAHASTATGA